MRDAIPLDGISGSGKLLYFLFSEVTQILSKIARRAVITEVFTLRVVGEGRSRILLRYESPSGRLVDGVPLATSSRF